MTWFNEYEPFPAQWLRNLWPDATVDERSISDLGADDVRGLRRAHFFAGIGGWEYALELAGWPRDREVWTGSCPCQPFSVAGKGKGTADERHLWPEFLRLIALRRPATVFGEQVASRAGREWLAGVRADLEALGYAFGAADLCAASSGAPHIRQRMFWLADATDDGLARGQGARGGRSGAAYGEQARGVGDSDREGPQGRHERRHGAGEWATGTPSVGRFWDAYDLIPCRDGKSRRVEPGTFPLVGRLPGRVGRLRAYGNAIVPPLAATFVRAFMETE